MRLWDPVDGSPQGQITGEFRSVFGVAFSTDGRFFGLSGDMTGVIDTEDSGAVRRMEAWSLPCFEPLEGGHLVDGTGVCSQHLSRSAIQLIVELALRPGMPGHGVAPDVVRRRPRHNLGILAALSGDGRRLALAGRGPEIALWDVASMKPLPSLRGHVRDVTALAFAPDGATLASASADGTVRIWNPETGTPRAQLTGHTDAVRAVAFSPDGTLLATAGVDETIRIYHSTGRSTTFSTYPVRREVRPHAFWREPDCALPRQAGPIAAMALSPDSARLATASGDRVIHVWTLKRCREEFSFSGLGGPVSSLAFSHDGRELAAVGANGFIYFLNLAARNLGKSLKAEGGRAVAYSPDGRLLAYGGDRMILHVLDAKTFRELKIVGNFQRPHRRVTALQFSPDSMRLMVGTDEGRGVDLVDLTGHEPTRGIGPTTRGIDIYPFAVVSASGGPVHVVDYHRGIMGVQQEPGVLTDVGVPFEGNLHYHASPSVFPGRGRGGVMWRLNGASAEFYQVWDSRGIKFMEFSLRRDLVVIADWDGAVRSYRLDRRFPKVAVTGHSILDAQGGVAFSGHLKPVTALGFSHDGNALVSASADGSVHTWQLASRELRRVVPPTNTPISALVSAPGGKFIVAIHPDHLPRFSDQHGEGWTYNNRPWDTLGFGQELGPIRALAYSLDGSAAMMARDGSVSLRRGRYMDEFLRIKSQGGMAMAYLPDARSLVTGHGDGSISVWDAIGGQRQAAWKGHAVGITAIALLSGTRLIATIDEGGNAKFWNMETFQEAPFLGSAPRPIRKIAGSPNGEFVATIGDDPVVRVWDAAGGALVQEFHGHSATVLDIAFHPRGRLLASAGDDRIVRVDKIRRESGDVPGKGVLTEPAVERPREDVDTPPAAATGPDPDAYAVVIGVERYRHPGLPSAQFAARDARAVGAYLTRSMGFDPKNVVVLENEAAGKGDLVKYLGTWLRNRATAKGRLLVFFAGHGTPHPETGEGYLLPHDADANYPEDTGYGLRALYETLGGLPSRDIRVVLDACFSGLGPRSVLAMGTRPLVTVQSSAGAVGANTVVIAAASARQVSGSYRESQHGLLTHFVLKGLSGAADADRDGRVVTGELFGYVRPLVEAEARRQNIKQTPEIIPGLERLGPRREAVWIKLR